MNYVGLLRGINVGGNSTVSMARLKQVFEHVGMTSVATYINSGNVFFSSTLLHEAEIAMLLERAIETQFGFAVKVLVRSSERLLATAQALPKSWVNNPTMKCDVIFLWPEIDTFDILEKVSINREVDSVKYVSGALLWSVKRADRTKSRMQKLIGTDLYKQMTIRNCNTVRVLADRVEQLGVADSPGRPPRR